MNKPVPLAVLTVGTAAVLTAAAVLLVAGAQALDRSPTRLPTSPSVTETYAVPSYAPSADPLPSYNPSQRTTPAPLKSPQDTNPNHSSTPVGDTHSTNIQSDASRVDGESRFK